MIPIEIEMFDNGTITQFLVGATGNVRFRSPADLESAQSKASAAGSSLNWQRLDQFSSDQVNSLFSSANTSFYPFSTATNAGGIGIASLAWVLKPS